jgi:predicted nucleotidyltransferase
LALDIEKVKATVKDYADEVRQIMPVVKVFLYGSYARGNPAKYSDVDICFFVQSFGNKGCIEVMKKLLELSSKYLIGIEPNVFEESELYDDDPFVEEVLRTGIEIQ